MWFSDDDLKRSLYAALAVAAIVGWAVIEVVLWVISNISVSWG